MKSPSKWDIRFLRLAREIAGWSKDVSTKVSAVGVSPDRSKIYVGYNGLARKMLDDTAILNNRDRKYKKIIHAEINMCLQAKDDLTGFTLYSWPFPPCSRCAPVIVQAGITKVISLENNQGDLIRTDSNIIKTWQDEFDDAKETFDMCGVKMYLYKPEILNG